MSRPRSPIFGRGINDLPYNVSIRVEGGKQVLCPYYATWRRMFRRCYSKTDQTLHPTYRLAEVSEEWSRASNFKVWMEEQVWEGLHLDKDLLIPGNKVYSPETCVFIPQRLNKLLLIRENDRGDYPLGVSLRSNPRNYSFEKPLISQITRNGSGVRCIGYFSDKKVAHKAWQLAKAGEIEEAVKWYASQPSFRTDVAEALTQRAWKLRLDCVTSAETVRL